MAQSIRSVAPDAVLTGPASAYNTKFTVPFAQDESSNISLLTQHYYRANGQDPTSTLNLLLQPDSSLISTLQTLSAQAKASAIPMGYRMAESNSFYNGGAPNVSDGYGTALWVLDYMFTCALNNCAGVNLHGGNDGPGYTPIADIHGVVQDVRAEFYGITLFSQAANGTTLPATVTVDGNTNFTAYGVARSDGGTNVVLVNKDPVNAIRTTINLATTATSATSLLLTGPTLNSTSGMTLGGVTINADGSWQPAPAAPVALNNGQIVVTVPPISAILLRTQ
jgi:hypothetical protein